AHRFMRTTLPERSARVIGVPSGPLKARFFNDCGGSAGSMAATCPVAASPAFFARSVFASQAATACSSTEAVTAALLPDRSPFTYTAIAPAATPATAASAIRRSVGRCHLPFDILFTNSSETPGYHDERRKSQQPHVGWTICLGSGRHHGSNQRLDRLRPQALRPGHPRVARPCRDAGETRHHFGRGSTADR